MSHRYHPHEQKQDQQTPHSGKAENDRNKMGEQAPTQKNEGRRTPESRHDREAQIGNNQSKVRGGSPQGDRLGANTRVNNRGGGG